MSDRPILIIDAYSLFIRHFVANPSMSSKGEASGGVIGFLISLRWMLQNSNPERVFVVWESGGSAKKRGIFKEYKSQRKPEKLNRFYDDDIPNTLENRNWQVTALVQILRFVPINQIYVENCEADDVIGYISRFVFPNSKKVILSSDKDFYQLLDENTIIYSPTSKKFVDDKSVKERFGISSTNFCLAKALCGDPSDSIPGIQGLGFKTAAKRFPSLNTSEQVTITDILTEAKARIKEKKSPKVYQHVIEGEGLIRRNWKLMFLDTAMLSSDQIKKINSQIQTFEPSRDKMGLLRKLIKEGLSSFDADSFFYAFSCITN